MSNISARYVHMKAEKQYLILMQHLIQAQLCAQGEATMGSYDREEVCKEISGRMGQ